MNSRRRASEHDRKLAAMCWNDRMATIQTGIPGHDNGTAIIRLRLGKLIDKDGRRVWDRTTEGPWEIICPGCGDDTGRDWSEVSPQLRAVRGVHPTADDAEAAFMDHFGMRRPR
jgi:hypothetical protein